VRRMAQRQIIVLEVTTGAGHGAPADWDWNSLMDGGAWPELARVLAAGPVETVQAPDGEEDDDD